MKTAAYIPLHRAVPLFLCPAGFCSDVSARCFTSTDRMFFRNRSRVRRKRMPCVLWSPAGRHARRHAPC